MWLRCLFRGTHDLRLMSNDSWRETDETSRRTRQLGHNPWILMLWKLLVALVLARSHRNAFLHQELCETNETRLWPFRAGTAYCTAHWQVQQKPLNVAENSATELLLFPLSKKKEWMPCKHSSRISKWCLAFVIFSRERDRHATPWSESWEYCCLVLLSKEWLGNLWQTAGVFVFWRRSTYLCLTHQTILFSRECLDSLCMHRGFSEF